MGRPPGIAAPSSSFIEGRLGLSMVISIHFGSAFYPYQIRRRKMSVNLSIKNVPDEIAEALRESAEIFLDIN
jgi:hypothetical protein